MHTIKFVHIGVVLLLCAFQLEATVKRDIDLSALYKGISEDRLPKEIIPLSYEIKLEPNIEEQTFCGLVKIKLRWINDFKKIFLHAHFDLILKDDKIKLQKIKRDIGNGTTFENIIILRSGRLPRKTIYVLHLKEIVQKDSECVLEIPFEGNIWETADGLFRGYYTNSTTLSQEVYLATNLKPNNARRLFPCFDEPGLKVPFTVSIARPKNFTTVFNTPLLRTIQHPVLSHYMLDYFDKTPPMSTFTFGFVVSKLNRWSINPMNETYNLSSPTINIWSNKFSTELQEVHEKLYLVYETINDYFNLTIPLPKIDVLAIPDLPTINSNGIWGILTIRETELFKEGYFVLARELVNQWIGSWITPEWWSEANVNKALTSFLAAEFAMTIDGGVEFNGKYPMTILYSLYYELSKRYPHSRITGMKQETESFKTELVIRMLNFTLGKSTFQNGLRKFILNHRYKTFIGDDIWIALSNQAIKDGTLDSGLNISYIAESWISQNRLPLITVNRDYDKGTAKINQKVYLRERPHDVPDKEKMLWWIPIIISRQDTLNLPNYTSKVWMNRTKEINIANLPDKSQFIIINKEEVGPFPVNYDEENWNMLSNFLQTAKGRSAIPTYTRAKLLHDAWNLAYAGDLSFATAFNMTLFMKYERNHIVWSPVFTFIDHFGRYIDMSEVHTKFERYTIYFLAPLYEELGPESENEKHCKTEMRKLAKTFLCRAGYPPCIAEAQQSFGMWINESNTDFDRIPKEYICPVFKWGSMEEWKFGLKYVSQFPKSRLRSERTFLLKMLVGCPSEHEKINHLLDLALLGPNSNFTENDILLIFNTLTGGSVGYTSLLKFVVKNWTFIRQRFQTKTNLWDKLISSATGMFATQKGYNMVKDFYDQHLGQFGSAQHIIEKSLRNIKEEAQWSDQNLPVIEKWLETFLSNTISKK
ncbi:aminopeptidase N isoform X1 [Drosophila pseudoobscura]|uniref:Aminopeptidase N isoform X1 n=1 Tax=Drosophila pseudoobscura pseudoobscura TaxID=46245 RepID=A0A6I8WDY9_DROPS|nr:aminopeptidase N isoform X1 [Drosophila pseudoobscura]XP_033241604.1 aminopeptidase N isoform X1 [Drosophila pseudoobscura]